MRSDLAQPLVVVVVLNTNRRDDTLVCVASLAALEYSNHRVLLLDNASIDGSAEAVAAQFSGVRILPLTENLGYAGNNNVGIEAAMAMGAEWILVLNEDTVLAPTCVTELLRVAGDDARIGVLGPMVYHHDEPGVIQSAGGLLDRHWTARHAGENEDDTGQFAAPRRVDWVSGCAILVRREAVQHAGALDHRFFYYWEETEWCLRIARAGWSIVHVPAAKVWHKGVTRDYRPAPSVAYYDTRNRLLMMSKHRAPLGAWAHTWSQVVRTLIGHALRLRQRDRRASRNAIWWGAMDFVGGRWGRMPRR
jgi:GT2 family glycosyltransferase